MRPTKADYEIIEAAIHQEFAEMLGAESEPGGFDPGRKSAPVPPPPWEPLLGPTQREIFYDQSDLVGACGEKYTGKSIVFADKVVAHCYMEWDALAVIIGNSHRALAEGICHDLTSFTIPRWRDGNRAPMFLRQGSKLVPNPQAGELIDHGIGLEATSWKTDPNNKDLYLKIRNRFGGWSRIRVIAIPYAEMVQARVTNLNASLYYLEEATRCDGDGYYVYPSMQLYRRRGINGPQQFLFSCNPDDPENWVYPWMYKDVVVGPSDPGKNWPDDPEKPGVRRDPNTAFYYLHYHENEVNVSAKNREILKKTLRANPILRQRLFECKWVAMPKGDALFKGEFVETRHMAGDAEKKQGIVPMVGHPIVVSMDWGSRNMGLSIRQIIECKEGPFELTVDELCYYQEMHETRAVALAILEKMRFWTHWLWGKMEWTPEGARKDEEGRPVEVPRWSWWFICGDDATTNWNPASGNIHARDLEDRMREIIEESPERYLGLDPPRFRGCPRPKDSVSKRVDIVAESLMIDMAKISQLCPGHRGMFLHLPQAKDQPGTPEGGNRWIHVFDAYSYASYYRRFFLKKGYYNFKEGPAIEVS